MTRTLALLLAAAVPAAALGNVLPAAAPTVRSLVQRVLDPPPAPPAPQRRIERAAPRTFPREVAALLTRLEDGPAAREAAELLARLGILGNTDQVDAVLPWLEHGNAVVTGAAAQALARLGGSRAADRLIADATSADPARFNAAIPALGLLEDRHAVPTLAELARGADAWKRSLSLDALALRGGAAARSVLHRAFLEAAPGDEWQAALAVATLGDAVDLRLLLAEATRPDGRRRDAALQALTSAADPRVDALLIDLANESTGQHQVAVVQALGAVRDPAVIDVLDRALRSGPGLRQAALTSLGSSRAPGALDLLMGAVDLVSVHDAWSLTNALATRPEEQAREVLAVLAAEDGALAREALTALTNAGDPRAAALLVDRFDETGRLPDGQHLLYLAQHGGEEGWSLLEEALAVGTMDQRSSAVWALQARGDEDAVARLLDLAREDRSWLGTNAANALEGMGEGARDELRGLALERLQDGSNLEETAQLLARLGGDEAAGALLGRLDTAADHERGSVLRALGQLEDEQARAALREAVESGGPGIRTEAFHAMLWGPQGVDPEAVTLGLTDDDVSIRVAAISALPASGLAGADEQLTGLLQDDDVSVRSSALGALAEVGGPLAEEALLGALDDPEIATNAVWGLQSMGTAEARAGLRAAAASDNPELRGMALGALSDDYSPEAEELLVGALHDDDPSVALASLGTLQTRGGVAAGEAFVGLLGSEQEGMAWQAALALQSMGGDLAAEHAEQIEAILGGPMDPTWYGEDAPIVDYELSYEE